MRAEQFRRFGASLAVRTLLAFSGAPAERLTRLVVVPPRVDPPHTYAWRVRGEGRSGSTSVEALLQEGREAFRRGDKAASRRAFEAALEMGETGEAREGFARALYLQVDYPGSLESHERAYVAYRREGNAMGAARVARMLAWLHGSLYGDWAVGNGWLGRARGFLEEAAENSCEHGWVELIRGLSESDARTREHRFRNALAIGRRFGDADLEFEALGWVGMELVMGSQTEKGMRILDEALAAACAGEVDDLYVVEGLFCSMLSACERAHDVARAEQWIRAADDMVERWHLVAIGAYCRAHYGGILTAAGRWDEAEHQLAEAKRVFERGHPAQHAKILVRLAYLRVLQGRFEEAAEFLQGLDEHPDAVQPLVALRVAQGELALARDLLDRALSQPGTDAAVAGPLLALLVDVHLAEGAVEDAAGVAGQLSELAARHPGEFLTACAALAQGKVCAASGAGDPRDSFRSAIRAFSRAQMPAELARARLELAKATAADHPDVAVQEAMVALETLQRLGATHDADAAAAVLRALGVPGRTGPRGRVGLTSREAEVLGLLGYGLSNREIAERLFISAKTVEHHVGRILSKLGLRSRAQAAAYAIRTAEEKTRS